MKGGAVLFIHALNRYASRKVSEIYEIARYLSPSHVLRVPCLRISGKHSEEGNIMRRASLKSIRQIFYVIVIRECVLVITSRHVG